MLSMSSERRNDMKQCGGYLEAMDFHGGEVNAMHRLTTQYISLTLRLFTLLHHSQEALPRRTLSRRNGICIHRSQHSNDTWIVYLPCCCR